MTIPVIYFQPEEVARHLIKKFNIGDVSQDAKAMVNEGITIMTATIKALLLLLRYSPDACRELLSRITITDETEFKEAITLVKASKSIIRDQSQIDKLDKLVSIATLLKSIVEKKYKSDNYNLFDLNPDEQNYVTCTLSTACVTCLIEVSEYISELTQDNSRGSSPSQ